MARVAQLCRIGIGTQHMEDWKAYASTVLGHEVSRDSTESRMLLRIDDHHHRLAIEPAAVEDVRYITWQVAEPGALQDLAASVEKEGIEVQAATAEEAADRRVTELVWFLDPHTGLRTELAAGPEMMFQPRVSPSRPNDGFVTGDGGLGHIVLFVADLEATVRFYVEVFGFGVTDWAVIPGIGRVAAFLHCNSRHHSLALFLNPAASRHIQHVMFETGSMDDVGITHDICKEKELVTVTPGRHVNDRSFSFYFKNPSGWHFEYGWSPRVIDPGTWNVEFYNVLQPNGGEWGHEGLMNLFM